MKVTQKWGKYGSQDGNYIVEEFDKLDALKSSTLLQLKVFVTGLTGQK